MIILTALRGLQPRMLLSCTQNGASVGNTAHMGPYMLRASIWRPHAEADKRNQGHPYAHPARDRLLRGTSSTPLSRSSLRRQERWSCSDGCLRPDSPKCARSTQIRRRYTHRSCILRNCWGCAPNKYQPISPPTHWRYAVDLHNPPVVLKHASRVRT
jgi:hypothetical protein